MARTTSAAVKDILVDHYDSDAAPDLTAFIQSAGSLVDRVAAEDDGGILDSDDKELIERWLAAHFYLHADQIESSRSAGGASSSFQGQTGMVLNSTTYGQTAMLLDATNLLAQMSQEAASGMKKKAKCIWAGKPASSTTRLTSTR